MHPPKGQVLASSGRSGSWPKAGCFFPPQKGESRSVRKMCESRWVCLLHFLRRGGRGGEPSVALLWLRSPSCPVDSALCSPFSEKNSSLHSTNQKWLPFFPMEIHWHLSKGKPQGNQLSLGPLKEDTGDNFDFHKGGLYILSGLALLVARE